MQVQQWARACGAQPWLGGTCSAERANSVRTGVSGAVCGTHGVWGGGTV